MVVGTARLVFRIPSASSLKDKRSVVRRLIDRSRSRFHAAVAEVDALDVHQRAVLGIAVVSNDARHATSMLDTITHAMAESANALLVERRASVVHMGEHDFDAPARVDAWGPGSRRDPWDDEGPR